MKSIIALTILCVVAVSARTRVGEDHQILLVNGFINTKDTPKLSEALTTRDLSPEVVDQYIVHVSHPLKASEKATLNAELAPYHLGQYLPHNAYLVVAPATAVTALEEHEYVDWTGHYSPELRVIPGLAEEAAAWAKGNQERLPEHKRSADDEEPHTELWVVLTPEVRGRKTRTKEHAVAIAAKWADALDDDVTVTAASEKKMVVNMPASRAEAVAAQLATFPEAHWIEVAKLYTTLNKFATSLIQGNKQDGSFKHSFWDAGLDGSGQIVGVGDSGADISHCFFYDPDNALPVYPDTNQNHRKVVMYYAYVDADDSDYANGGGHGTHVAGSVLGDSNTGNDDNAYLSNGMATGAKMTFFDMGVTTAAQGNLGSIYTPADLGSEMLAYGYDVGARIHTNSWGAGAPPSYTSNAMEIDAYVHDNRDMLVLFAAGNDGTLGPGSIGSPAEAKNILSVGATHNTYQSERDYCCLDDNEPCTIPPGLACNAGYTADIENNEEYYNEENMAIFSSQGPVFDGRIKPDISAPGHRTMSAASNGESGTQQCTLNGDYEYLAHMSGTSMATPTLAGTAAVVRQYYEDGWYPSGEANSKDSLKPTASLMKATLIGGAVDMKGFVDTSAGLVDTGKTPNNYEGFGRTDLSTTLYAKDTTNSEDFGMTVFSNEDDQVDTGDESDEYCFQGRTAEKGGPIKVTLVWTDPAASVGAATALVNDLDLIVTQGSNTWYGNGGTSEDGTNNVEQVVIDEPENKEYCAKVVGSNVPDGPQEYSLTAQGSMVGEGDKKFPLGAIIAIIAGVMLLGGAAGAAVYYKKQQALGGMGGGYGPSSYSPSTPGSYAPTTPSAPGSYAPPQYDAPSHRAPPSGPVYNEAPYSGAPQY